MGSGHSCKRAKRKRCIASRVSVIKQTTLHLTPGYRNLAQTKSAVVRMRGRAVCDCMRVGLIDYWIRHLKRLSFWSQESRQFHPPLGKYGGEEVRVMWWGRDHRIGKMGKEERGWSVIYLIIWQIRSISDIRRYVTGTRDEYVCGTGINGEENRI